MLVVVSDVVPFRAVVEELGDDFHKLEKWKNRLLEKYPSEAGVYDTTQTKLEECRMKLTAFERGVLKKSLHSK